MNVDFATDEELFASLPGGQPVIDWFGFCPSFHDASLERLELAANCATMTIRAFRTTNETNANGYFVLDLHTLVTLRMSRVTGLKLEGDAGSIIMDFAIRRIETDATSSEWPTCGGPERGDIQIAFDTSIGLTGAIYAKGVTFELEPLSATST